MAIELYRRATSCRICGSGNLESVVDLGPQALSGIFPNREEPDPPRIPLELLRCTDCGLVQLAHSVTPAALYTYNYGYRSGINSSMTNHLAGLTDWIRQRCFFSRGDVVLDIGCNDGTLLKSYGSQDGLHRVGIDAVAGKFKNDYPPDIELHEGYFDATTYAAVCGTRKCKAITSISMFYDLESPNDFVAAIKTALAPDGIWVLEQSYLVTMLEANSYDTVCHEHLEYYAFRQIDHLAKKHGLRVFDAELNNCNGGSIRLAVCHEVGPYALNDAVRAISDKEDEIDLSDAAVFKAFASRIKRSKEELLAFIDRERSLGKTFFLYGASTKGNTLLQYCGLDSSRIIAAAERNPEKFGCRTPGTGIPIIAEDQARAQRPDYFLVLPWHFREEFLARETDFRNNGGKFVFPLPKLEIV
jgi:NDP-4-keto-2,6-dideoxyhexose 3-C-methyltransferase